ncbi:hypothetical protein [Glutamicibacter sp. PS]|uniref:hypothetical protein n=1 Tax=Glutamicibacter sp. PS TaxID=3075634 RepID=UPI00283B253E|nr:hypothetical protein [Glutamicibacter sp. PS]MDR4533212.1 hypothetical protein [Glutamicibacter sp. PS]
MGKPGFVEARPKGGGDIRLVPEHYLTNPALGFVETASVRDTGVRAKKIAKPETDPGQAVEKGEAK